MNKLQHHEEGIFIQCAEFVQTHEVGMIEAYQDARLTDETFYKIPICGKARMNYLDRTLFIQVYVPGPVDGTHPAPADDVQDFILANASSY
jgi:hypothetical protein